MHDIYKQKCLVKSIYLVLQIKHCKKVHSSIGFKASRFRKKENNNHLIFFDWYALSNKLPVNCFSFKDLKVDAVT